MVVRGANSVLSISDVHDPAILRAQNLGVCFTQTSGVEVSLVHGVSFSATRKQVTAIVGESGSGKTLTALALIGLLPSRRMRVSPSSAITFEGRELLKLPEQQLSALRGTAIAMIFQDPNASLNPVLPIGQQIAQPLRKHLNLSRKQARSRAIDLLFEVGIPAPEERIHFYPHELSGGQKQRVMIAMAISCEPTLLIADEPTSALDVTVQRQILDLIGRLQSAHGLSIIFITHDLGVAAEIADQVIVMHQGSIQEMGDEEAVLFSSSNDYTRALVAAQSRLARPKEIRASDAHHPRQSVDRAVVLSAIDLKKDYAIRSGFRKWRLAPAVNGVSFILHRGETLGVVGESGSGKTTVAMMLLRLIEATAGTAYLDGQEVLEVPLREFRHLRRRIQLVFQNPYASLNPRWTIRQTLMEPMRLHNIGGDRQDREKRAADLLGRVGLQRAALDKFPDEFSGGERQRIAIARCLSVGPEILVCDECVSALDVSIQLQVLDLLLDLQAERGMSLLFISHDLTVIRYIADRVLVMQNGLVVETADTETIFAAPQHPYTRQLLAAIPSINRWL